MDNQKIQEHVQKVRFALSKAEPGPWEINGREIRGTVRDRDDFVMEICKSVQSDIMPHNQRLIANSPTWHKQSLDIIEQQQREIERLQRREQLESSTAFWAREGLIEKMEREISRLQVERDKAIEGLRHVAHDTDRKLLTEEEAVALCNQYLSELGVPHDPLD